MSLRDTGVPPAPVIPAQAGIHASWERVLPNPLSRNPFCYRLKSIGQFLTPRAYSTGNMLSGAHRFAPMGTEHSTHRLYHRSCAQKRTPIIGLISPVSAGAVSSSLRPLGPGLSPSLRPERRRNLVQPRDPGATPEDAIRRQVGNAKVDLRPVAALPGSPGEGRLVFLLMVALRPAHRHSE